MMFKIKSKLHFLLTSIIIQQEDNGLVIKEKEIGVVWYFSGMFREIVESKTKKFTPKFNDKSQSNLT